MANDCLVTKLKGVVNNPNLPKLGELIISFKSDDAQQSFYIEVISGETVTISCDKPLSIDGVSGNTFDITGGKSVITPNANEQYDIHILNKYAISILQGDYIGIMDFKNFSYLTNLYLIIFNTFKGLSSIDMTEFFKTSPNLTHSCQLKGKYAGEVPGSLAANHIAGWIRLNSEGSPSPLKGDWTNVSLNPNGSFDGWFFLEGVDIIIPDIAAFINGVTTISNLSLVNSPNISGDISDPRMNYVTLFRGNLGSFRWRNTRNIHMVMEGVNFESIQDVDNMLIDQAAADWSAELYKTISVHPAPSNTPEIATALSTLAEKGVSVSFW